MNVKTRQGTVMHTKKMDDGDYKLFLNLDEKFKFLTNEKNNEKTDGFMVVEMVPPDQDTNRSNSSKGR